MECCAVLPELSLEEVLAYFEVRELLGSMAARLEASHEDGEEGLEPKEMLPLRNRALIHATQQWCLRKYKTALQREEAVLGRLRK
ncbi:hypothetical protein FJT64_016878 [Amphibalanus amphitrite]|uniref:Uncharacterized protein n=1 Tax=Amphibalanus amphitrite TaxID=1232801 RepID=A0A6A4XD40_AMPAM|nr:hypothetical protein FJT64_016878 [Amphibalanus amphitrite]